MQIHLVNTRATPNIILNIYFVDLNWYVVCSNWSFSMVSAAGTKILESMSYVCEINLQNKFSHYVSVLAIMYQFVKYQTWERMSVCKFQKCSFSCQLGLQRYSVATILRFLFFIFSYFKHFFSVICNNWYKLTSAGWLRN